MKKRCFLFNEGKIVEKECIEERDGEKLYFQKSPRNFLELIDTLKKLSFLCNGVYVVLLDAQMEILLFKRDSLELFTKLSLSIEPLKLELNERLKEFLISIEEE